MKQLFNHQVIRFIIVGGINTFNYLILYYFFVNVIGMKWLLSRILAFVISMIGSFFMNTLFTYSTRPTLDKFFKFPLTYVINLSVTTSAMYLLVDVIGLDKNISPILASLIAIPFTFIVSKKILLPKG